MFSCKISLKPIQSDHYFPHIPIYSHDFPWWWWWWEHMGTHGQHGNAMAWEAFIDHRYPTFPMLNVYIYIHMNIYYMYRCKTKCHERLVV
jgi:hypothetical protein